MAMTCPACGNGDVRKLSDLWDELRSGSRASLDRIEAEIAARLPAAGLDGDRDETLRSLVVRELAPPEKRADLPIGGSCLQMSFGVLMILVGFGAVVVAIVRLARSHLDPREIVIVALFALAVGAVGYSVGRYGLPKVTYKEYEERMLAWKCTYRCMTCGNHFAVDG